MSVIVTAATNIELDRFLGYHSRMAKMFFLQCFDYNFGNLLQARLPFYCGSLKKRMVCIVIKLYWFNSECGAYK